MKALDEKRIELAGREWKWEITKSMDVAIVAKGKNLQGFVDGELVLEAEDGQFVSGGIGVVMTEGSAMVKEFRVQPVEEEGVRNHL